jgi:NhaP-type Na+/H+ or K+/H+ antiporter
MLNDVIGYTSYESFLDIHLLTESAHKISKVFSVLMWIGIAIAMGYLIGLLTALLCKYTGTSGQDNGADMNESMRDIDNTLYSTDFAVMFLAPWIAYLLAETLDMSAILTIFFCGLSLGQYAIHNLSPGCRQVPFSYQFTAKTYGAISEICESISFIYIGVSFYGFGIHNDK